MDPLFFYVPIIFNDAPTTCVRKDKHLAVIVTVFRSIVDIFYVINIVRPVELGVGVSLAVSVLMASMGEFCICKPWVCFPLL